MGMPKRPRDPNQLAKLIVDIATGEAEDTVSSKMRNQSKVRGRAGGLKGGTACAKVLSQDQRREVAVKAARTRWSAPRPE